MSAAKLAVRLERAQAHLDAVRSYHAKVDKLVTARTPSDPGMVSGIRRTPSVSADASADALLARYARSLDRLSAAERTVEAITKQLDAARAEEGRVPFTRDQIVGADAVKTSTGWRTVRKVNRTTVSVETGFSWTDRIPFDQVLSTYRQGD
ncbi:hypothetical protein [Microcella pacifica]|uniref:Uncharacterized protein n=1 Tax=Microcella pacifica TaxID=2591847 RepID=A0A9E5JMP6_9MICO|nr:hypothetical protein [Microcella pacifica]NHF62262.1 hypothetical protein [Microcella pacifica]